MLTTARTYPVRYLHPRPVLSLSISPTLSAEIGAPRFRINVTQDKSTITLDIEDPVTAIHSGSKLLNIRDIFKSDLQYKVFYRKAQSTGKVNSLARDGAVLCYVLTGTKSRLSAELTVGPTWPSFEQREKTTSSSRVVLDVDRGVSYCFNVQAYVPSRLGTKQDGRLSSTRCSPGGDRSGMAELNSGRLNSTRCPVDFISRFSIQFSGVGRWQVV